MRPSRAVVFTQYGPIAVAITCTPSEGESKSTTADASGRHEKDPEFVSCISVTDSGKSRRVERVEVFSTQGQHLAIWTHRHNMTDEDPREVTQHEMQGSVLTRGSCARARGLDGMLYCVRFTELFCEWPDCSFLNTPTKAAC